MTRYERASRAPGRSALRRRGMGSSQRACSQQCISRTSCYGEPIMVPEFANEPLTDFAQSVPDRQAMEAALREVKGEFDRQWPLVIGGQRVTTTAWIDSHNPCPKQQIVGPTARAGRVGARRAPDAAWSAFADWSQWQPAERARLLLKAAALLRRR